MKGTKVKVVSTLNPFGEPLAWKDAEHKYLNQIGTVVNCFLGTAWVQFETEYPELIFTNNLKIIEEDVKID